MHTIQKIMRRRRTTSVLLTILLLLAVSVIDYANQPSSEAEFGARQSNIDTSQLFAKIVLDKLKVKGRAPKTGYTRGQFSTGWTELGGCDTRNRILSRDLKDQRLGDDGCTVLQGTLLDPYSGEAIDFVRGKNSNDVQIDHVVAISDAWQKGAQAMTYEKRRQFYHDDLNLIAVAGWANQQKADGDTATWLPANKPFRCQYVARQIATKHKYNLWLTRAEYNAMSRILETCPEQRLPSP